MKRVIFSAAHLCFLTLLAACPAGALDDWQPITPEELKMTADPAHPADAIILYHEENANHNLNSLSVYKRVKILTEKGKSYSDVKIPYGFGNSGITGFKARTVSPDGSVTPFSGKPFDSTIIQGQKIKIRAKTFALPNVQVGSIIEWKYIEYWDNLLYEPHWSVQDDIPQKQAKFTFTPLLKPGYSVILEHGETADRVSYSMIGLSNDTHIKNYIDGRMELELKDIPAFEEEEFGLPEEAMKWRVDFFYGSGAITKKEEFWKEEGKYWSKDVEKFIGHSGEVSKAAAELVAAGDTPEQKVRKLYAAVQKMRNKSYEPQAEMEEMLRELKPDERKPKRTAEDVLHDKAGTSVELTRLFVAMVRSVDIPAFVMRVADRNQTIFRPEVLNWRQLSTEIAIVSPAGGKELFLDPGTPVCPFGLLEWKRTGVQGVRQTASGGTQISETPVPEYRDAYTQRFVRANLNPEGDLKGKITLAWLGQEGLEHRLLSVRTDEAGRKKELEDELKAMLPANAEVQLDSVKGWDDTNAPLVASFNVHIPSYTNNAGKRLLLPVDVFQLRSKPVLTSSERKTPVYFPYPYQTHDDIMLGLPATVKVENVPATEPIKADFAYYKIQRTVNGKVLEVKRDFAINGMAFPQKDYSRLKDFFNNVNTADAEQLLLTPAAN